MTFVNTLVDVNITWDPTKAEENLRSHQIRFSEAATVLEDDRALTRNDPDTVGEQRFVTLGASGNGNLLVVVYTYRDPNQIRIISAWKATPPPEIAI